MDNASDIIKNNTQLTIESLQEMYKDINLEKNKSFYKMIAKYYSAISIIILNLKKFEKNDDKVILLDNILLNFCSLIHCVVLKDIKLINFIFRNILESVIRYITEDITTRNVESLFKILTSCSPDTYSGAHLVQKYSGQLKNIYTKNCLYVHTATSKIPSNLVNLFDYRNNSNDDEMLDLMNDFNILNIAVITLFKVLEKNLYLSIPMNAKIYIDEITPLASRIEYQSFLHDCDERNRIARTY